MKDLKQEILGALDPHPHNGRRVTVAHFPAAEWGARDPRLIPDQATYEWSDWRGCWSLVSHSNGMVFWPTAITP